MFAEEGRIYRNYLEIALNRVLNQLCDLEADCLNDTHLHVQVVSVKETLP